MPRAKVKKTGKMKKPDTLAALRGIGKAAIADFALLGITRPAQLKTASADALYTRLCAITGHRHDPCMHDVFEAAIYQAKTGKAVDWWTFTPARKKRQAAGTFPV